MRDKHLGVMAQFGQTSVYLYYIYEVKLLDGNLTTKPVDLSADLVQSWCN